MEMETESSGEPAAVTRRLLEAFSAADLEGMRALLAEDVVAYVTNAEGAMDEVEGRQAYLSRVEAMDLPSARFSVELTQRLVAVGPDQVLVMSRSGRSAAPGRCTTSPPTCCGSRADGSPSGEWSTQSPLRATRSGLRSAQGRTALAAPILGIGRDSHLSWTD
jgi:ketosteroid isomerase-like protein